MRNPQAFQQRVLINIQLRSEVAIQQFPVDFLQGVQGERLACFIHPTKQPPHLWLTRDYGAWGPRGAQGFHNATFTIAEADTGYVVDQFSRPFNYVGDTRRNTMHDIRNEMLREAREDLK